ncbi:CTB family bacteriocin [Anabaena sp. CCY 0017]|uniref:CTB family bacteriocin n=1 Tax=Anabaena sp. CCY 0017 TaxID=3103866 RepID=UPI0039C73D62
MSNQLFTEVSVEQQEIVAGGFFTVLAEKSKSTFAEGFTSISSTEANRFGANTFSFFDAFRIATAEQDRLAILP